MPWFGGLDTGTRLPVSSLLHGSFVGGQSGVGVFGGGREEVGFFRVEGEK